MKVLWFANTPSLGANYLNVKGIGGGWIESLEAEINSIPNIILGVVFKWNKPGGASKFNIGNTQYFPVSISKPQGKTKKLLNRWSHKIEIEENIPQYLEIIRQFTPDIIHIFGSENDFGLVIRKTSVPCIIHIQGNLNVYNHKWFNGISQIDVLRYSRKKLLLMGYGLIHNYYVMKKEAKRERDIFRDCQFFMGRTDWDKRITLALSGSSQYFHCDEMIRKPFYQHRWEHKKTKEYVIFTTIRNNIYKGLETIFESMNLLQEKRKELNFIWKIAGISSKDEISNIVERKFNLTFTDLGIQLLGPLQESQLIIEMLGADLFVHPSHIDNSPNSVCEAMLLGMPIISSNAGGIPSLMSDKKEGLLVQNGDPFALTGAILELSSDRNLAYSLGENARIKAIDRHKPEKIVNNLLQIYTSIISDDRIRRTINQDIIQPV